MEGFVENLKDAAKSALGDRYDAVYSFYWGLRVNAIDMASGVMDYRSRYAAIYLVSFVVLGAVAYALHYRGRHPQARGGFFAFLFPRDVYLHPSAVTDYKLFLVNGLLTPSFWLASTIGVALIAVQVETFLNGVFGVRDSAAEPSWLTLCVVAIALALATDFATYATHALHHLNPYLWEFHKVHHSAEVLTPISLYRKHPVYDLISRLIDAAIVGPLQGVVLFLWSGTLDAATIFGVNMIFAVFYFLGGNLRHSHIWLSFGPTLERIVVSPAQHQIHHSRNPKHWDKNFGEVFAIWDWMFGTIYIPKEREELRFGVGDGTDPQHRGLASAYAGPFRDFARLVRKRLRGEPVATPAKALAAAAQSRAAEPSVQAAAGGLAPKATLNAPYDDPA